MNEEKQLHALKYHSFRHRYSLEQYNSIHNKDLSRKYHLQFWFHYQHRFAYM